MIFHRKQCSMHDCEQSHRSTQSQNDNVTFIEQRPHSPTLNPAWVNTTLWHAGLHKSECVCVSVCMRVSPVPEEKPGRLKLYCLTSSYQRSATSFPIHREDKGYRLSHNIILVCCLCHYCLTETQAKTPRVPAEMTAARKY